MTTGKVYLVGAGPGDPGLLTVKGAECLRAADVVVYDRLSSPQLLALAPPEAERVFMGKEPDTPSGFQDQINETLVKAALAGKKVVRLKGGDPFVFGRGGEEIDALRAAGAPFEVVPGITSAIAVPAYAGVPVTHRGVATAFTVVSGSEDPTKPESSLDWPALARTPGTLIVLMGWRSLPAIVDSLLANGRGPETPVAVTQWGTTPKQRTVTATLADIVEKGNAAKLTSPVITVIGEVAALRDRMRWFDTGPLFGKRILVTRARQQASALSRMLAEHGADPIEVPSIEIQPPESYDALDKALMNIQEYDWVVLTSTNGVHAAAERIRQMGKDARALAGVRIAAIGPATAAALGEFGICPDYMPDTFTSEATVEGFKRFDMTGARVLMPRADIATDVLSNGLRGQGATVEDVIAYRTVIPEDAAGKAREVLESGSVDIVTFTSSSTVKNLMDLLQGDTALLQNVRIASIGPVTSETARSLGLRV
ncbi:MAG: uroporphyrinogen-III C-methyltransferase, partial [Dehalococcoidia bacterium]